MGLPGRRPNVSKLGNRLTIEFCSSPQLRPVGVGLILDLNEYGDVIGIEIVSLKHYAGSTVLDGYDWHGINSFPGMKYTYDEEVDAFYLKLVEGRPLDQEAVDGILQLNTEGHLCQLEAELTGTEHLKGRSK